MTTRAGRCLLTLFAASALRVWSSSCGGEDTPRLGGVLGRASSVVRLLEVGFGMGFNMGVMFECVGTGYGHIKAMVRDEQANKMFAGFEKCRHNTDSVCR